MGTEGPLIPPGSPAWRQTMTASKVAAVVGLSPWESYFSLYHRMAGILPWQPQTDEMSRGLYLEDGICKWFADRHPEYAVVRSGTWTHDKYAWMTAAPDRKCYGAHGLTAVFDAKTSNEWWLWGESGTDEIPPGYRAQLIWQLDCVGVKKAHIAVLLSNLEFAEYVVEYDADEALWLRTEAHAFLRAIETGERPNIDDHSETYLALREMHSEIDPSDVELDGELARRFVLAKDALAEAEAEVQLTRSLVLDAMGNAKRARFDDHTIATRQSKQGGKPYLVMGRKLPTFGQAA